MQVLTWALHSPSTLLDGEDQEEQEALRSRPGLLGGPFICFTNTMLSRSQITRLLSRSTKVTPIVLALSLRSTAKVGQNLFEGLDIQAESSRHLEPVGGPTLLRPRRRGLHSGVSRPWAATGPWSVLPEALAPGLLLRPPDPRPGGSPSSPTRASGFLLRPIPQTGSPGTETGGVSVASGLFVKQLLPWQHGYY